MAIATAPLAETPLEVTHFELLPGKMLDIQINHPVKTRLKLPLIGYHPSKYIIIKYPKTTSTCSYKDVLLEGNGVIVRYLHDGECFAFSSSIHSITQYPDKYLVINHPVKIEHRQLRLHQRVVTHIPASIVFSNDTVSANDEKISGIIEDISSKGCGFSFKTNHQTCYTNQTEMTVIVQSALEGEIKIPAKVCNRRNGHGKFSIGLKFCDGNKEVKHLLECLFIHCDD